MKISKANLFGSLLLGGILLTSFYGITKTMASGDYESGEHEFGEHEREHEHEHERKHDYRYGSESGAYQRYVQPQISPATRNIGSKYVEECGSCHMAYPAQLLPVPSWVAILTNLDDHFGENAEVDQNTRMALQQYLTQMSGVYGSRGFQRNVNGDIPLRITELPYFIRKHDEIPSRYIRGNDKVRSLSQCNACHRGAERGNFDEDNVAIPGVGRWD